MTLTQDEPVRVLNPEADTFSADRVVWVLDDAGLALLEEAVERAEEVVLDKETTGLNEHETGRRPGYPVPARIVLVSFTLPQEGRRAGEDPFTYLLPLAHPESPWLGSWRSVLTRIARKLRETGKPLVNQHLKFDLKWLYAHTGVDLSAQFSWDTMYGSHLLDETTSTALKERAPEMFGIRRWDDFDLKTPGAALRVPLIDLGLYAARDTYWTWKLAELQRALLSVGEDAPDPYSPEEVELVRLGQLAVWCEIPKGATLTAIEQRGMVLDRGWVEEKAAALSRIADEAWDDLAGRYEVFSTSDPSFAPTSLWFRAWAEAAVKAGDLRVTALTPNGKPQWDRHVLRRQARNGAEVAETLLVYRGASKQLEFLNSWLDLVTPRSRIHTTYWAGRVVTGRLSSSEPNMQQVTKSLKPAFLPSPGYVIAELDYSQIELRAAAFISRCEPMLAAYRAGQDLHTLMAAQVTGKRPEDVTKEERQSGKAGDFGLLYGMSPGGFMDYADDVYGVVLTEEEALRMHAAFFQLWDGMANWHRRVVREAHAYGQVTSPLGRVRRLPDLQSGNGYLVGQAERQAINSPVQGFASDLMQLAAASIEGYLPGHSAVPEIRLVGTVHDSIVVEVPEEDWKRGTARCMRRMLDLAPVLERMGCLLDVPLGVEASVGSRWGQSDVGVIKA